MKMRLIGLSAMSALMADYFFGITGPSYQWSYLQNELYHFAGGVFLAMVFARNSKVISATYLKVILAGMVWELYEYLFIWFPQLASLIRYLFGIRLGKSLNAWDSAFDLVLCIAGVFLLKTLLRYKFFRKVLG